MPPVHLLATSLAEGAGCVRRSVMSFAIVHSFRVFRGFLAKKAWDDGTRQRSRDTADYWRCQLHRDFTSWLSWFRCSWASPGCRLLVAGGVRVVIVPAT